MPHRQHRRFRDFDLAPLFQERMLRSRERRETYDVIAGELCDYGLEWSGAPVDAQAFRCRTDDLAIYSIRYGDEVTVRPDLYPDFVLAHVSLRKGIEIESDGRIAHAPEGAVYFSAPKRRISLRWQEGCEQLLVRAPCSPIAPEGVAAGLGTGALKTGALLPASRTQVFLQQLNMILALARQAPEDAGFEAWRADLRRSFGRFIALHLAEPAPRGKARPPGL